ncbi:MAG TPA: MauE/DoxX family redox-associated membrane protein [Gaiellaceae bacterium]
MLSLDLIARLVVAIALLWAGASKLVARDPSVLATYGVPRRWRTATLAALTGVELATGVLLLAGVPGAAYAGLTLGCVFVASLLSVRLRGISRIRCGCFGSKEQRTDVLLGRAVLFTALAAFGAVADVEVGAPSRDAFIVAALVVLAVAVLALGALVLALYRQVGVLTMRLGPSVALELAEEGPSIGDEAPELDGLGRVGDELVAFFSPDCRLCRAIAPGVRAFEREGMPVRTVYEHEEPVAFERWSVPGTPFVVHVVDGLVAAKGTVNSLEQLDGLVALGGARVEHAPA